MNKICWHSILVKDIQMAEAGPVLTVLVMLEWAEHPQFLFWCWLPHVKLSGSGKQPFCFLFFCFVKLIAARSHQSAHLKIQPVTIFKFYPIYLCPRYNYRFGSWGTIKYTEISLLWAVFSVLKQRLAQHAAHGVIMFTLLEFQLSKTVGN